MIKISFKFHKNVSMPLRPCFIVMYIKHQVTNFPPFIHFSDDYVKEKKKIFSGKNNQKSKST